MKATILGLIAGSLFGTIQSSERLRPDLRHWSQDLYQSAPVFEDFEDFLSDLDLRDDPADLEAAQKKRTESLKALESIDLTKESRGRGYVIAKQMVELSLQISSFLRMQEERKFYYASNQWRLQNPESLQALPHEGEIEQNSLKAVGYARNLVNNYDFEPDYGLYILIRLLGRTRNANMLLFHEQFKQRFQTSKYTHLVEQIVAEYYFNLKQWDKAEPLLKQVIASKNPQLRPYAIYKLAWVHIMRADKSSQKEQKSASLDQAQIALRLCLKLMKDWDFYQPVFDLKNEVAKDLALLYAEQRTPNIEVAKYFSDNDFKTSYLNFLRYLAIDTTRDANSEGAKAAFAEYLPMGAEQLDFPQDLLSQIEMFYLTKSFEQMLAAYKNIRELYLPPNAWYLKWHEDSLLFNHGQSQLAQHLVLMAMKIQQDAEKASHQLATDKQPKNASPQKPAYDEKQLLTFSRSFYDLLFEWFPSSDVLDSARYNYALLVFQLGEMEQGIVLLGQVANDPKSKYRRDASYSLVLTAASWDAKQPVPQLPEASQVKSPIPLTQSKALLVEKIDNFVTSWPDAEEALVANYTAAQILFDFGHYEKASKRFDALINKAPKSEQAGAALNTLLSYMVEKSQWEQLLVLCKSYLSNKEIVAAGHRKLIRQTLDYARSQAAPKQS